MCLLPGRQGAENDRYNRYAIAGQFSMLMTEQCTAVHKNTSPDTHGQDMVIAGKLVLIGHKMPPTHNPQVLVCRLSAKRYFFTNCGFSGDGEALSGSWACEPLLKKHPGILEILDLMLSWVPGEKDLILNLGLI